MESQEDLFKQGEIYFQSDDSKMWVDDELVSQLLKQKMV